ncbi:MAG: carboxypeptidase, partial [Saprospiraceae bacterium]|nr:carboxypeptidase [Saprospiraceae bacterium]
MMKKLLHCLILMSLVASTQAQDRMLPSDTMIVTNHEVNVRGQRIPYEATVGTQPVWNDSGKTIASLHYTYYRRTDINDASNRPLVISFNGGPGSGSVWMHIAYTGPRVLKIDSEGFPVQPYGVRENPNTILDVADIVYVNPVNTGYSRILDKEVEKKVFFGVNADIKYLAEWLNTFVTRKNRWTCPKYLIGESYGTTRVSGLALELQNAQWMYLNGVVLVSPTGLGVERDGPVGYATRLPYFTAAAWYHKALDPALQNRDLTDLLNEVETYTIEELIPVMAEGGFVDESTKKAAAEKMAFYSGISAEVIQEHNLIVPTSFFWK